MNFQYLKFEREDSFAILMLNRPEALNALSSTLMQELAQALEELDGDPSIRCIILTGTDKVFAAGADIKEMARFTRAEIQKSDPLANWDRIYKVKKPMIAAVSGYAFGGGCELAMMCDVIVASETAKFGQLEVNIGIIPGAGGTQRLTRAIGKSRAMEWILTGNIYSAQEALQAGLVSRVVSVGEYLNEAKKIAKTIAEKSPLAIAKAKKAVLLSMELPLEEGLRKERDLVFQLFGTEDQKEGMQAFLEKRRPKFNGN